MTIPASLLDIDLGSIVANWRLLCTRHPTGPVASVLKADAYGLGAQLVAPALFAAGCRHFFVAHLAEALSIREFVPGAMLAVLDGPLPNEAADYAAHGIVPVLGSLAEIAAWHGPALLHVDTGMNRLGLPEAELAVLASEPARLRGIELLYIMTHLVSSERPDDPINAVQLRQFKLACARLPAAPRSLANSSGLFLGPDFGSGLARPGAALYGINPTPSAANPMQAVVRLRARILQVRDVPAGATVGYNGAWTAPRPSRIGTAAVGYADGLPRSLSNRGAACFDGGRVPLVGRVSMDLSTFDLTDTPQAQPGDWLDLIGPQLPVDEVAAMAGTNGYEILTSLGRRYHRTYTPA